MRFERHHFVRFTLRCVRRRNKGRSGILAQGNRETADATRKIQIEMEIIVYRAKFAVRNKIEILAFRIERGIAQSIQTGLLRDATRPFSHLANDDV